jgi:hypothetical protein
MRDDIKRQVQAAGGKLAGGKAKAKPAGQKRNSGQNKNTPPPQEGEPAEEEEVDSTEQITPNPRYYQSTTKTPEGLGMARLVGFTEQQWNELVPLLHQQGFRPY